MLSIEQYFLIYLLYLIIMKNRDIRIICLFLSLNFVIDSYVYSILKYSIVEYMISISILEISGAFLTFQFIKNWITKNLFLFCYLPTLIAPFFFLGINHFITRDDFLSDFLYMFCVHVGKYSNEIFLTYTMTINRDKSYRSIFWQIFAIANYLMLLI